MDSGVCWWEILLNTQPLYSTVVGRHDEEDNTTHHRQQNFEVAVSSCSSSTTCFSYILHFEVVCSMFEIIRNK